MTARPLTYHQRGGLIALFGQPPPLVAQEPGSVSDLLAELSAAADGFAARAALLTRTRDPAALEGLARDAFGLERLAQRTRAAMGKEAAANGNP